MELSQIKEYAIIEYNNTHISNKTEEELIRIVKNQNGTIMARHGWQYSDDIINRLIEEVKYEIFFRI